MKICVLRSKGQARKVWIRKNGPIPEGLEVCHRCDNPRCIELSHLFLGTHQENMQDCISKGRFIYPQPWWAVGNSHPGLKFSPEIIREIRKQWRTERGR